MAHLDPDLVEQMARAVEAEQAALTHARRSIRRARSEATVALGALSSRPGPRAAQTREGLVDVVYALERLEEILA